ncbi:unnamed protein product [Diamesa hyperborea]
MKLQELCFKLYMFPWLARLADWKGVCQYYNRATPFPLITLAPGATFPTTPITIPNPFVTSTQVPILVTTPPSVQPLTTTQLPISTITLLPPNLSTTQSAPLTTLIPITQPQTTLSTIITTFPTTMNPIIVTTSPMNPSVTNTVPPFPVTSTALPITTIIPTFPTNLPTVPSTTCPPFPTVCPPNTPGGSVNAGEGVIDPRQILRQLPNLCPYGTPGNCINFRYCPHIVSLILQINQKKDDAIENYIRRSVCGFDNLDPLVCCPALIFMDTSSSSAQQPFVFSTVNSQPPAPAQPITILQPLPPSAPDSLPTNDRDKCGVSNTTKTRVVGGVNAQLGSYPWLAALGYKSTTIRYLCAGTLITQKHVLTAAHCIKDNLVLARLGEYDISSDNDGANPVDYNVELRIIHESFDAKTISNDIGLLKLSQIVTVTDFIRPICMPLADAIRYKDLTYYQPFVAGWGSTSFKGPAATILQEVQLPILPLTECEFNYRLYFPNQVFDNRVLCAGYSQGGKDSCQGDSGGGLVLPQLSTDGSYYYYNLVGIVSYGFECARAGFPGIYSRVTSFLPWIQQHIND